MSSQAASAPFIWTRGWGSEASRTIGNYKPSSSDGFSRFHDLLRRRRAETYFASLMREKIENRNFQRIVNELGEQAIPWIIDEIRKTPDFLVHTLYFITKENPVPPAAQGRIQETANAWLSWHARTYPNVD